MEKILIISHNDLDGVAANVIADQLLCSYKVKVVNLNNCEVDPYLKKLFLSTKNYKKYDHIIMSDLSMSENLAEKINNVIVKENINFKLLDHHKTALHLNRYNWAKVSVNGKDSGSSLLLSYIINNFDYYVYMENIANLTDFVNVVTRYDLWLWNEKTDPLPNDLNLLFYHYGIKEFVDAMSDTLTNSTNCKLKLRQYDLNIINKIKKEAKTYIDSKLKTVNSFTLNKELFNIDNDFKVGLVEAKENHSVLGDKIVEVFGVDMAIIISNKGKKVSLRGRGSYDLSKIAKANGGGGHINSAGFTATEKQYNYLIEKASL